MDPGTALGTISLGIQVCEGLLGYYRDYRGYEEDCQEAYTQIDSLRKTFDYLDDKLKTLPQKAFATSAQECITGCQNSIEQLSAVLKKIEAQPPAGIWQRLEAKGRRLLYPFKKDTLERLKSIVQKMVQPLDLAIQLILLDNSQYIKDTVDTTEELATEIKAITLDTNAQTTTIAAGLRDILSEKERKELATILTWLSAPDPSSNHAQAHEKHELGTGEWLLKSKEYQDWVSGWTPLLWLHGKAGCCKTIMCSAIIEDISQRISDQDGCSIAYFYFSFSDAQKQNYLNLLLSMVTQLSRGRTVHPLLLDAYAQIQPGRPSFRVLESILVALFERDQVVYIVVDALDECSEDERERVILGFKRVTQILPKIRLLMTSRKEADIEDLMTSWCRSQLPINKSSVNRDIDVFVKNALATDRKLMRLSSTTKKEIKETFHEKSDGMFRWATLQLAQIRSLKILRPSYISNALRVMPRTLHATYDRVFDSIEEAYFEEARNALQWLAFSHVPLTIAELAEACSIRLDDADESYFDDAGYKALSGLFSVLSSLILVEQSFTVSDKFVGSKFGSDAWEFGHHASDSGLDPFEMDASSEASDTSFDATEIHTSSEVSDSSFNAPDIDNGSDASEFASNALRTNSSSEASDSGSDAWRSYTSHNSSQKIRIKHKYRRACYTKYVRLAHFSVKEYLVSDTLQKSNFRLSRWKLSGPEVNRFLGESCSAYILHCAAKPEIPIDDLSHWSPERDKHIQASIKDSPLLPYACEQWIKHQYLAESDIEVQIRDKSPHIRVLSDSRPRSLWLRMCIPGCTDDYGAEPDWFYGTNPLYWASYHGLRQTVCLLCSPAFCQDVNKKGGMHETAIQAAAYQGHDEIVGTLLTNGADVKSRGKLFSTALVAAAAGGHSSIVSTILGVTRSTRTRNLRSELNGSAIEVAAAKGYTRVVDQLCQAHMSHRGAIMEAIKRGHEEVVEVLIKHGADLNARFSSFRFGWKQTGSYSPWPAHSISKRNINSFTSVLELAAAKCSDSMVEKLLQAGADAKIHSGPLLTNAAKTGRFKLFRLLNRAGEKIETWFSETLSAAITSESVEMVDYLLKANVAVTPDHLREAIPHRYWKSKDSHIILERIAENLITTGMGVQEKDEFFVLAAAAGLESLVLMLLQAGACIHSCASWKEEDDASNALIAASANHHDNVVKLLLTKDAFAYDIDYQGQTLPCKQVALMRAICFVNEHGASAASEDEIIRGATVIQSLIDAGADIHANNDSALYFVMEPRMSVRRPAQEPIAQLLLANGANVKARDDQFDSNPDYATTRRVSILYGAMHTGNFKLVELTLRHGADVNGYGWTWFPTRAPGSRPDLDDRNTYKDHNGNSLARHETVLVGALRNPDVGRNIVELLLENGADVKSLDDDAVCSLVVAAWIGEPYLEDLKSEKSKAVVIVDKLLQVRGANDTVFDESRNNAPLKKALRRIDRDRMYLLGDIKNLLQELRAVFLARCNDEND